MAAPSTSQSDDQIIFRCVNCITDIRGIRFTCKQNECEDVHLCGECFCMHAEPGKHKKTHPYEIWNEASFKLFGSADEEDQWLCIDEQRLLQAVERYGHGNWTDAASMVPGKCSKQVEEHYNDFYVDGNIGNVTWKVGGYSSERALVRDVGIPECSPKQTARNIQLLTNLEVAEMNYMPSRDEFYKEYDNEAEEEISQLVFQDGEDDLDRRMKLALIDGCQRRLQERTRRKNVASEFGLLHLFLKHQDAYPGCEGVRLHKGETRFRTEICANLKLFLQYMTFDELISFLQNLTNQIELKARIRDLCRARKHGVTRLDAMSHFEIARQHRERYMQGKDQDGVEVAELAPEELQVLEKDVEEYRSSRENARVITSGINSKDSTDILLVPAEVTPSTTTTRRRSLELLSEQERQLCADLRIEPKLYMDYKLRIVLLVERKRQEIGELPGLSTVQTEKLVNYLAATGLLKLSSKSKRRRVHSEDRESRRRKERRLDDTKRQPQDHGNAERGPERESRSPDHKTVNEMKPAGKSFDETWRESLALESSPPASTGAKRLPRSTHMAAHAQSASSKHSIDRAFLLTSLQGDLASLKPRLAKCPPAELLKLKSRLSPQSFAIIQQLAQGDPKPVSSSSSSSPSDESSSSSIIASSEDEIEYSSRLSTQNNASFERSGEGHRNYHFDSGLFYRSFAPPVTSSLSSSTISVPPPNDHDYYSVRPHNGPLR